MNNQESYKWKVCVKCMTYNQANYITDAMNGFAMQQTDFPYVCCIVDDCSTDGEQEVIKQYLKYNFDLEDKSVIRNEETDDYVLCFAQHKSNKNCYFSVLFLKYNHYGKKSKLPYYEEWQNNAKYIALCEGDDYWIFCKKLQIQVDFLEKHDEVVLSCHRYSILDVKIGSSCLMKDMFFDKRNNRDKDAYIFDLEYVYGVQWVTKTLTLVVRSSAITKDLHKVFKYARDVHFVYYVLKKGLGVCHAMDAGVYRKNVATSIFGNLDVSTKASVNAVVYQEMAELTKDPIIVKKANLLTVKDCMFRLKVCGRDFYWLVRLLRFFHLIASRFKKLSSPSFYPKPS